MSTPKSIQVSCTIGNVIFYVRKGKYCARSKPARIKQNAGTKRSACYFGLAQTAAANIRAAFKSILPDKEVFDRKNALASSIHQWMLEKGMDNKEKEELLLYIKGFEFNSKSAIAERWRVTLVVNRMPDNILKLAIPAFYPLQQIQAPAYTTLVEVNIAAACCAITTKQLTGKYITSFQLPYTDALIDTQEIVLPIQTAPGNLTVVFVSLHYMVSKKGHKEMVKEQRWLPGGIVGAFYN